MYSGRSINGKYIEAGTYMGHYVTLQLLNTLTFHFNSDLLKLKMPFHIFKDAIIKLATSR